MKTLFAYLLLFACIHLASGQVMVRDHHNRRQLQRSVYERWGTFTPKWYFILFHNNYRKGEDKRLQRQLLPAIGYTSQTGSQATTESEEAQGYTEDHLTEQLSRTSAVSYHLYYKEQLEKLAQTFTALITKAEKLAGPNDDQDDLGIFELEATIIDEYVEIILDGNLPEGKRDEALRLAAGNYQQLNGRLHSYLCKLELASKLAHPTGKER